MIYRALQEHVYTDTYGVVLPRYTGALSAISSAGIIYLISISEKKLQIVYHRIMALISVADILSSVAVGLTTLPMPSPENELWHYTSFEGTTRLGNVRTCEAQGFFFIFGTFSTYLYTCSLCIYYACAIAYQMQEETIKKKIETKLHILGLGLALAISVPNLFMGMYNPSEGSSWCTLRPLPSWCNGSDPCVRGFAINGILNITMIAVLVFGFLVIVISLYLVNRKVYLQNKMTKKYTEQLQQRMADVQGSDSETADHHAIGIQIRLRRLAIRSARIQSIAYVASFTSTVFFDLYSVILHFVSNEGTKCCIDNVTIQKLKIFFRTIQGFFNFLIFAGSKLVSIYRNYPNISPQLAFKILFCGGAPRTSRIGNSFEDDRGDNFISEEANLVLITGIHFIEGEDGFIEPYLSYADDIDWIDRNNFSNNSAVQVEESSTTMMVSNCDDDIVRSGDRASQSNSRNNNHSVVTEDVTDGETSNSPSLPFGASSIAGKKSSTSNELDDNESPVDYAFQFTTKNNQDRNEEEQTREPHESFFVGKKRKASGKLKIQRRGKMTESMSLISK